MLETLDHTIRIGSTPPFLYFDLYLYSAYAAHYVYYMLCLASTPPPSPTPPAKFGRYAYEENSHLLLLFRVVCIKLL